MEFTAESQIVKNYVLLIEQDIKNKDEIPNLFNLREVVESVINNKNSMEGDEDDI